MDKFDNVLESNMILPKFYKLLASKRVVRFLRFSEVVPTA